MRCFILLICLTCLGCQKKALIKTYVKFNIDSLLNTQIQYLRTLDLSLEKRSQINSKINSTNLSGNDINWENEFETFRSISVINKPSYSNRFNIKVEPDPKSNLTIRSWIATDELPLKMLKIFYIEPSHQIKKLEVEMIQSNFVFSSTKKLRLNFSSLGTKPTLEEYEVSGYQKFIWEDPQQYSLKGIVNPK